MKRLFLLLAMVTLVNGAIFFFKDKFQFVKYSSYQELYGPCDEGCTAKWKTLIAEYPPSETEAARKILAPLKLDTASTLSKIKIAGSFIYQKFYRQQGVPAYAMATASPVTQYNMLLTDTAQKLFCGTWVHLFGFFCWSQNITCRYIEIFRDGDHHVVTECYVPELGQWVLVDLSNGMLWALVGHHLLNLQELKGQMGKQSVIILSALTGEPVAYADFSGKESLAHYYRPADDCYYYNQPGSVAEHKTADKLKRYLWPSYWYEIFSPATHFNVLFYLKIIALLGWLVIAGITIKRLNK